MSMKVTMAEFVGLEPCPFCGGEASVKVLEYDEDCKVWGVFCESDLQSEYSHGHFVDNYATEAKAIAAWNSRAERTCKMETDHDELEVIAYSHEDTWAYKCSACDWSFRYDRGIKPNYCPNCGARRVGE